MSYKLNTTKKEDWVSAVIIDDNEEETLNCQDNTEEEFEIIPKPKKSENQLHDLIVKKKKNIPEKPLLKQMYNEDPIIVEIGIDEAGRGPMFGRVYAGVAVLPKDCTFDHSQMKDSKKFHSKKKIEQVAQYIKDNAIAWAVEYEDEDIIDKINILQATQSAMHKGIKNVLSQLANLTDLKYENVLLLVDGNYFKPINILNQSKTKLENIKYHTIEGGDNKYTSIAAASILAKVERDNYIDELCSENPELIEHYGIDSNKGYGSKKHMDGIKQFGITKWHRKTFGICKEYC
jgi:ribonuclease HII